jgi:hypothetical protein
VVMKGSVIVRRKPMMKTDGANRRFETPANHVGTSG